MRVSNQVYSPELFADTVRHGDVPLPFEDLLVGLRADTYEVLGMEEVVRVGTKQIFRLVAE